ncbi:MAG: hypothetical protein IT323_12045 [Anaerolineae bacterium]|nr:hypothetical protein [Anaerolineae bacterium]
MSNKPGKTEKNVDVDDLRNSVLRDEFETDFDVVEVDRRKAGEGRIFGLTAGERMILSVVLFLAVSVISVALLLLTNTIQLP